MHAAQPARRAGTRSRSRSPTQGAIPADLAPGRYALAAPPVDGGRVALELRGEARLRATNGAAVGGRFEAQVSATLSDCAGERQRHRHARSFACAAPGGGWAPAR